MIGSQLSLLSPAVVVADDSPGVIAVLPLGATEDRLAMYGMPVARTLASNLSKSVSGPVEAWSTSRSLPKRIALVVDGRIVARPNGQIVLEARVRDPGRGRASGQVATRAAALTEVDQLTQELATQVAVLIERERRTHEQVDARRPRQVGVAGESPASPAATRRAADHAQASSATIANQVVLLGPDREPIVTDALTAVVRRLGFEVRLGSLDGIVGPDKVRAALAESGARYALLHKVESVDYRWKGVLTARGTVRVVMVDRDGVAIYDELIETDTLVGARGDRHAALLAYLARQVADAAWPRLKKVVHR